MRSRSIFFYGWRHWILIFYLFRSFLFALNLSKYIWSWLWIWTFLRLSINYSIRHRKIHFLIVVLLLSLRPFLHPYLVHECFLREMSTSWMWMDLIVFYFRLNFCCCLYVGLLQIYSRLIWVYSILENKCSLELIILLV